MQHEDATVPEVVAGGEIALGGFRIRLLEEGIHLERAAAEPIERRALADVAVAGVGVRRLDAEQHQAAGGGNFRCAAHGLGKARLVSYGVVGRHHHHDRARVIAADRQGGNRDRRRSIARDRLQDERARLDASLLELLFHQEPMIIVAQQRRRLEAAGGRQALQRGAQEARALAIEEANELLRVHGARQRPQPRAGAAGKDYGMQSGRRGADAQVLHLVRSPTNSGGSVFGNVRTRRSVSPDSTWDTVGPGHIIRLSTASGFQARVEAPHFS